MFYRHANPFRRCDAINATDFGIPPTLVMVSVIVRAPTVPPAIFGCRKIILREVDHERACFYFRCINRCGHSLCGVIQPGFKYGCDTYTLGDSYEYNNYTLRQL